VVEEEVRDAEEEDDKAEEEEDTTKKPQSLSLSYHLPEEEDAPRRHSAPERWGGGEWV
jgi:hypothetical protein